MSNSDQPRTSSRPSVLIDVGHPAHVHLFRNFAAHLQKHGIPFLIASRDKDLTNSLLEHYGLNYVTISRQADTLSGQFLEFLLRTFRILKLHLRYRFTLALGTSVSIGYLSLFTLGKVQSYNFCEDDDDAIPLQANLAYPFSTKIVNPDCIRFTRWTSKRVLLPTFHELAYLHPDNFTPDVDVPRKYGLEPGRYVILRLSSLKAHHDRNEKGITPALLNKIKESIGDLRLLESKELAARQHIAPWEMHDVLAFSKLIISDSQTMTIEAALLGTPSIRISTFKNRLSCLQEIEGRLTNALSFHPNSTQAILNAVRESVELNCGYRSRNGVVDWIRSEKIDLAAWMRSTFAETTIQK